MKAAPSSKEAAFISTYLLEYGHKSSKGAACEKSLILLSLPSVADPQMGRRSYLSLHERRGCVSLPGLASVRLPSEHAEILG